MEPNDPQNQPPIPPQVSAPPPPPSGAVVGHFGIEEDAQPTGSVPAAAPAPTGSAFVTGSQLHEKRKQLPVGVYIIAGYNLLAFIAGFFDTSQTSAIYTFAMLANLLVGIGLLLRMEMARVVMIWLTVATIVLAVVSIALLVLLQQKVDQAKANYDTAISRIDKSRMTTAQKKLVADLDTALTSRQKQLGKLLLFSYIKLGITVLAGVGIVVYLTRPRVQEAFEPLPA